MKKRLLALCMALTVLLSGCTGFSDYVKQLQNGLKNQMMIGDVVSFRDMEYTRPDIGHVEATLQESCRLAAEAETVEEVMDGVYAFYDVYDGFCTNINLANIYYSRDLTDLYWEQEYSFCLEQTATVDAALEELYYALADSPHREALESETYFGADYFDAYDGETIWDEMFLSLLEQEAALQDRYYELSSQALETEYYSQEFFAAYSPQMAQLFVELIALRQQIAAYVGYDSYPEFAYDFYYARDYTPAQAEAYMQDIGTELSGLYRQLCVSDVWDGAAEYCSEADTFSYVRAAAFAMGGTVEEAFNLLAQAELYDISYSANKYDASFEIYLWSYYEPFIFMNPTMGQDDKLKFAHEFGHFVNDYISYGSYAGMDVSEVHSQAMEFMSLCYGSDTEYLTRYKMADCLCTYVEQSAYALFEQQVYSLTGEELTAENVQALYERIGTEFGLDSWGWDSRDFVTITHLYTNPMYITSYVVSNDLALQIYQLEQAEAGKGLKVFQDCLLSTDSYILQFAQTYGLENPFAEGRLQSVKEMLTAALG